MNGKVEQHSLIFENVWRTDVSAYRGDVQRVWEQNGGPKGAEAEARLGQVVFLVKNDGGEVVGISTAFKAYVKQVRNHFFLFRLMIVPEYRVPGLTSRLLVATRDFLESIHAQETTDRAIGVMTLVQNDQLKKFRNEAIWPASKMVYIGNSADGHHIRVYYFKGARIVP